MDQRHALGEMGEEMAAAFLMDQGLQIVERNLENAFAEIDLVARDRDIWVFVEVKTRDGDQQTSAAEAITRSKQSRIIRAAIAYIRYHKLHDQDVRFDVVLFENTEIEWIKSAFEAPPHYVG